MNTPNDKLPKEKHLSALLESYIKEAIDPETLKIFKKRAYTKDEKTEIIIEVAETMYYLRHIERLESLPKLLTEVERRTGNDSGERRPILEEVGEEMEETLTRSKTRYQETIETLTGIIKTSYIVSTLIESSAGTWESMTKKQLLDKVTKFEDYLKRPPEGLGGYPNSGTLLAVWYYGALQLVKGMTGVIKETKKITEIMPPDKITIKLN